MVMVISQTIDSAVDGTDVNKTLNAEELIKKIIKPLDAAKELAQMQGDNTPTPDDDYNTDGGSDAIARIVSSDIAKELAQMQGDNTPTPDDDYNTDGGSDAIARIVSSDIEKLCQMQKDGYTNVVGDIYLSTNDPKNQFYIGNVPGPGIVHTKKGSGISNALIYLIENSGEDVSISDLIDIGEWKNTKSAKMAMIQLRNIVNYNSEQLQITMERKNGNNAASYRLEKKTTPV